MKIHRFCQQCGKEILVKPSEIKRKKYCSRSCLGKMSTWLTPWPKGAPSWNKGLKTNLQTKQKLSESKKRYIVEHPEYLEQIIKIGRANLSRAETKQRSHSREAMDKVAQKNRINSKNNWQNLAIRARTLAGQIFGSGAYARLSPLQEKIIGIEVLKFKIKRREEYDKAGLSQLQ